MRIPLADTWFRRKATSERRLWLVSLVNNVFLDLKILAGVPTDEAMLSLLSQAFLAEATAPAGLAPPTVRKQLSRYYTPDVGTLA
jgi:hypothetical protein